MDIDEQPATREERLEDYARRQAEALESLRNYAFAWSLLAVLAMVVAGIAVLAN